MLPFSPTYSRSQIYNLFNINKFKILAFSNVENITKNLDKKTFIEENYKDLKINENFILNSYPYQYDIDFWYDILQLEENKRIDYRFLETKMIQRVVEINNNKLGNIYLG